MSKLVFLPPRQVDSHKGDYGRVLIVGGSIGMPGAVALAAWAAFRSGAGLVQIACPREIRATMATLVPCATTCLLVDYEKFSPTVRAIGPGCSEQLSAQDLKWLLEDKTSPIVLDADGLNVLARMNQWWNMMRPDVVLTPHLGEMRRLLEQTSLTYNSNERVDLCQQVARLCGAVIVLKGHQTVVCDRHQTYVNSTGNPGMATGGSGDVLTGIIAALIGQKLLPYDAACLGVHLHGLAGNFAAEQKGQISLMATDIIEALPRAFQAHQASIR